MADGVRQARGAWWGVAVLATLYAFSLLDRQVITVMIPAIRADLGVSDFEISLVQGLAFALFYSLFGLPLGLAADRLPRRKVILCGVFLWASATICCGLARSFGQLLVARFVVGIGEAALLPAAYSLIASSIDRRRLSFALSVLATGSIVGSAGALAFGGVILSILPQQGIEFPVIGHLAPWQMLFIIAALPCLSICWLVLTIPDVPRVVEDHGTSPGVLSIMRRRPRYFIGHFFGYGLGGLCSFGMVVWTPTYMVRAFGWPMDRIGIALSLLISCSGVAGSLLLSLFVDRSYARGRHDAHLRTFVFTGLIQIVLVILAMASTSPSLFLLFVTLAFGLTTTSGAASAALQIAVPPAARGRISAMFLLVIALLGPGLGPSAVAAITDFVFRSDNSVGWAIATTYVLVMPFSAAFLWLAARDQMRHAAAGAPDASAPLPLSLGDPGFPIRSGRNGIAEAGLTGLIPRPGNHDR